MGDKACVLHVTESFGGGVASAICSYARSSREFAHSHLLVCNARGQKTALNSGQLALFSSISSLSKNPFLASRQIFDVAQKHNANFVHLHSSFAGAYGRLISKLLHKNGIRIVYTPHCYAFERKDINPILLATFYLVEKFFALKMNDEDAFAACSSRELKLSKKLNSKPKSFFIPNLSELPTSKLKSASKSEKETMFAIGRLSKQKNPDLFIEIAKSALSNCDSDIDFTWVGDGPQNSRDDFESKSDGIAKITKWMSTQKMADFLKKLSKNSIFIHTALWEGFPVVLLDAASQNLPIIALKQEYFEGVDIPEKWLFSNVDEAISLINELKNPKMRSSNIKDWQNAFKNHTKAKQSAQLSKVYAIISS